MRTELKVVGARLTLEDRRFIKEVCKARGENISSFLRRALKRELARMGYFSEKERKALEVGK
jgi:post-segregation antitoxin (ccd killing protein)